MPGEAGVDESGGGVGEQAQPPQGTLAFQARGHVIRERHPLESGGESEFAGVKDERLVVLRLDEVGEFRLVLGRVDKRILVVVEQPEVAVEAHVDARRLDHGGVIGVEPDPPSLEFGLDVAVGEQHEKRLAERGC